MSTPLWIVIIAVAAAASFILGIVYRKKIGEREIASAEEEAKRIINESIKSAESKQSTTNTVHTNHKGRPPQRKPPTATSILPNAVATNQPPIIRPLSLGGATFDTNEIPIGERSNSAKVSTR